MKAVFAIKHLPGKKEKAITFKETFKLARLVQYVCPMKDTKPANHPGKCAKCGRSLERAAYIYSCPIHPKVTSRNRADKCWVCGIKLGAAHHKEKKEHGGHKEQKGHDEHKETKKEAKHGH